MKTMYKFIIAIVAVMAVSASCRKEPAVGTADGGTADGVRVISVQFDNSTKAHFDGFTPKFDNNDVIRVSNSEESVVCTLSVWGSTASFTTSLSGTLTAIYPADAAVLSSGAANAPIIDPWFKVPASQTGLAEDAIIAKATVGVGQNTATFYGQTAVFEITPPSGATSFTVTSLNTIDSGTGQRSTTANAVAINTTGASDAAKSVITVTGLDTGGKAYVALVPGVNLTDLSFEYTADASHGAMKGIPMKDITAAGKANATAANTKYTIDNNNWHPYVKIDGLKWATMNVGATAETGTDSYGKYFAWGDVIGQVLSSSAFTTPFDWVHAPFNNGQSSYDPTYFTSVRATECPSGILALKNDAAYANWGGAWRMPIRTEFDALIVNKEWDSTNKGYIFGASPNRIFIPAAGYGEGTTRENTDIAGNCWSSSLRGSQLQYAIDLDYHATYSLLLTQEHQRCTGRSIRPVADFDNFMFESYTDNGSF